MVVPPNMKGLRMIKVNRKKVIDDLSFRLSSSSFILMDNVDNKYFFICNRPYNTPCMYDYKTLINYRVEGQKVFKCKNVRHSGLGNKKVIKVEFI